MSPYSHNNGASGGKPSDKPQEFNADTFETYVKKFFIDNRVITEVSCDYADNKLTVHVSFGEPCSKFSFTFVVYFKNTITSKKEKTSYLQEVIYEFPNTAFVDMSLNESVFRVLHYQVKKRYKGAFAELQVVRILEEDKEKAIQSKVLASVLDYLIADTKTDKYAGIDIRLVVMTSKGREFLPIDIKSYENGLREVKDGVAGLFVDIHMSDEVILHKIKTLVEGFADGQHLRI